MNKLYEAALRKFREDGIRLDLPDDWPDLKRLYDAAQECTGHTGSRRFRAALKPVLYLEGGVRLRRPSIGVSEWMADVLIPWCGADARMMDLSALFCMAHSDSPEMFWEAESQGADNWIKRVKMWARNLKIDFADASELIREWEALGRDLDDMRSESEEEEDDESKAQFGWIIELLVREYGQTPDYWIWTAHMDEVIMLMNEWRARQDRESRQKASKGIYAMATDPDSSSTRALWRFREIEKSIRDRKASG